MDRETDRPIDIPDYRSIILKFENSKFSEVGQKAKSPFVVIFEGYLYAYHEFEKKLIKDFYQRAKVDFYSKVNLQTQFL